MSKVFRLPSLPKNIKTIKSNVKIAGCRTSKGKSETQIELEIRSWLDSENIFNEKINITGKPRWTKNGLILVKNEENIGGSDLRICYLGLYICLEVKKNGGLCSEDQLKKQNLVRLAGGIYEFVTSVTEVIELFKKIRR